ncbi:MAG TPA: hypothetical protein VKY89_12550 [Thermoanaerobaculia bacterium]|nr:hypothetical protein [Thermoanaerobaculia bacterium]
MTTEHPPLHHELARLLAACQGQGTVATVKPAGPPADHHHFYAGVARAPAHSFLEALLLVLGGNREDGSRRYQEIVVATAGTSWSGDDLQRSHDEVFTLPAAAAGGERGGAWGVWWYRRPAVAATAVEARPAPAAPASDGRPDPGGPRRSRESRMGAYGDTGAAARPGPEGAAAAAFPLQVAATETGDRFPKRCDQLRAIVQALEGRTHRTLLLLELGVLDYPNPEQAPKGHAEITGTGPSSLLWLPQWIDGRKGKPHLLDVVLYSRNRQVVEAFQGSGLPRRPPNHTGGWPTVAYRGRNVVAIDYPCGAFPWGPRFAGDQGFKPLDGAAPDGFEQRGAYPNRTLKALLRGESLAGGGARLKIADERPTPPPPGAASTLIDREFWSRVEVQLLRESLRRDYFGAEDNTAVQELLAAIELMQRKAQAIADPETFHETVKARWQRASALFLWGDGGVGKSFLGTLLSRLIYGLQDPPIISCQEMGDGHDIGHFRNQFFGPAPGYEGANDLKTAGRHLASTQGFGVLILDEVNRILPRFEDSMAVLFGILETRQYMPGNPSLVDHRPINLWNTIFVLSANLASFPPPEVQSQNRAAIERRVSAHHLRTLDRDGRSEFGQWYLPAALEKRLGGVVVCACGDLRGDIDRLALAAESPDVLIKDHFAPIVETAQSELERQGIASLSAPLFLDVTSVLRQALAAGADR